jgi:hypothetical protein
MLPRSATTCWRSKPAGIVMLMGTNDLEEGAEPETIAGNFKLIVDELKRHNPKLPIVVCSVFPVPRPKKRPADKIKKVNELYAAVVKGTAQVTLIDTWTLFADVKATRKPAEFPDLLHPNKAGYAKWASALRPILATLGFVETARGRLSNRTGFESLFNGRDLAGWTFRDAKTFAAAGDLAGNAASDDGRYVAKHGRLIVTTPPEGRRIQQLWTVRELPQDFTLKLEFLRDAERRQRRVPPQTATAMPRLPARAAPTRRSPSTGGRDWNELVIVVRGDNVAKCECNGELLEGMFKLPPTGPVGLEGDRGEMGDRRIRLAVDTAK